MGAGVKSVGQIFYECWREANGGASGAVMLGGLHIAYRPWVEVTQGDRERWERYAENVVRELEAEL